MLQLLQITINLGYKGGNLADIKVVKNNNIKRKTKKKINNNIKNFYIVSFIIIILLTFFNFSFFFLFNNKIKSSIVLENKFNFLGNMAIYYDMDINKYIEKAFTTDEINKIYKFYNEYIGDETITYNLILNALSYKIPLHKLIALCWQESNFKKNVKGKNNNGTFDYGLFQLNSNTYKNLIEKNGIDWILNPENNIKLGTIHLKEAYDKYGTWVEAFIAYNNGNIITIPVVSLKFVQNIFEYEKKLDKNFNQTFIKFHQ